MTNTLFLSQMTNAPTQAAQAEVSVVDSQARGPLLLLLGSGLVWLVISGILSLLASIQLHSPSFLADCAWFTAGRAQALRETSFLFGWGGNAGLALGLWILGRLGGSPLRALNWVVVGCLFWNLGITLGCVGIATGDMTSFQALQLPRYVQPLLAFAYAAIAVSGVLAWSGRRSDGAYASQWYVVAALFLLPWLLLVSQSVLLWIPLRGVVQTIAGAWHAQAVWSLWLAPLALGAAYYVVPKVTGRALPAYESAPLAFWTLVFLGAWTGGRHLIGGPVPAWIGTLALVAYGLILFHYLVVGLNLRGVLGTAGMPASFVAFGLVSYLLAGLLEFLTCFRGVALHTQYTLLQSALEQLGWQGAVSMLLLGGIYFMVPCVTGRPWASPALASGHRAMTMLGVGLLVAGLTAAGLKHSSGLLNPAVGLGALLSEMRGALLVVTAAQFILLAAHLLLLVNLVRSVLPCLELGGCCGLGGATGQSSSRREVHAS